MENDEIKKEVDSNESPLARVIKICLIIILGIYITSYYLHYRDFKYPPDGVIKTGCVGFNKLIRTEHSLIATKDPGIYNIPKDDGENNNGEAIFKLGIMNDDLNDIIIKEVNIEWPDNTHVIWSERGFNCSSYNIDGNNISGCREQIIPNGKVKKIYIEDIGKGEIVLRTGSIYELRINITYQNTNSNFFNETVICVGKIE